MTPDDDLDLRKTELEDGIDSLSAWMIGFTWPVAVGLFMEFYAILHPTWTHEWNVLIDRIGLLLVTAGVCGELAVEHKTHGAERRLREVNTRIESGANAIIERLRKENQETAIFLGDRRIIDPMEFQEAMHPFAGTVYMILATDDRESRAFASSLRHNLEEAGWVLNQFVRGSLIEGVQITESGFDDPGPCSAAAESLADALNGNRVATLTCLQNQAPPWAMQVWVGTKPDTPEMQKRIQDERKSQKQRRSGSGPKRTGGPLSPRG